MSEEAIKFFRDIEKLKNKLTGEDKEILEKEMYMFNECARMLEETEQEKRQLKDRIGKAITYIENQYYSKNTTNLENIWYTTNKLLKVREILKGVKDD